MRWRASRASDDLRRRFGEASRRIVAEGFSDVAVGAATVALYRALVAEIGAAPVEGRESASVRPKQPIGDEPHPFVHGFAEDDAGRAEKAGVEERPRAGVVVNRIGHDVESGARGSSPSRAACGWPR